MDKKSFIQSMVIRGFGAVGSDRFNEAIDYAETAWDALNKRGYGDAKQHEPNISNDWYAKLPDVQRKRFNAFWNAFSYKKGRNGAAMRWQQIGDMDDELFNWILHAAKLEADQQRPVGQSRIMAQGWLHEGRWADYDQPSQVITASPATLQIRELRSEISNLQRLYDGTSDPVLLDQKNAKQAELDLLLKNKVP